MVRNGFRPSAVSLMKLSTCLSCQLARQDVVMGKLAVWKQTFAARREALAERRGGLRWHVPPKKSGNSIGVFFRLVWLDIDGTGLQGFCSIYQGHLFFQKATYGQLSKMVSTNVDRIQVEPLFINMGVFLVLMRIHHFGGEHPRINKQGLLIRGQHHPPNRSYPTPVSAGGGLRLVDTILETRSG